MSDIRRDRSPRARRIAWILAATLVVALGAVRSKGSQSRAVLPIAAVADVDAPAPVRPTESSRVVERAPASPAAAPSPSGVPSPPRGAGTAPPVFDLAALADRKAPEPAVDRDRFRTNDKFSAEDLAHPERYFEAADRVPELQRDEERRDVLEYFLAYRAQLERDLAAAGRDPEKRAAVLAVIARYDAAIARLRSVLATASRALRR